ncbi:ThiJ/PfpI family protein [Colletotrichum navitas]|uniref:ThiJ/PfpI family protein n=1 Tax=Colletotrichum navitas TaxID=681940 RepID=A0AAD8QCC4_9PEZI|nr:ThiJ/PfpI family protein [Colletotrichum navitas]KAK1600001.1 ThiJ/PfpI family protein [Colletotrichum navitas]
MPNNKTVKVGVFIPTECQLLDMACVDVLASMSQEYLSLLPMLPKHIPALAPSMSFFYITAPATASGESTEPHSLGLLQLTAGAKIQATHDISHPDVQPGKLDILLVPGPEPSTDWDEDVLGFLKDHAEQRETTDVLSICTGVFLCGAAGVLEGKMVCGPRGFQDVLRKRFPGAEFVGEKYRWFQDGNFWSCGGITNGNDLVAAYARNSKKHFPPAIAEIGCQMTDVGDRPQLYEQGQTMFFMGFLWQIVKAWFGKPSKGTQRKNI